MQTREITGFYKPTPATLLLIAINLFIYGAMLWQGSDPLEPGSEDMVQWGATFAPHLLLGQWWRLISSQFVHFGLMHIGMNMFILYHIGLILERFLGSGKFLLTYLLTGLGASLASLWWYWNEPSVAAGASGAIFGLYGAYIAILTTRLISFRQRGPLLSSALTFVGYNVLFGFEPGVDNAAHIGGLLSGLLIGYSLYPILKSHTLSLWVGKFALPASFATLIGCGIFLFGNVQNPLRLTELDTLIFYDLTDEFMEIQAELSEKTRQLTTGDTDLITNEILPGWQEALSLIDEMQDLKLSEEDAKYRAELDEWVRRTIEHYNDYLQTIQHI